jgi:hypothetical protein
MCPLSNTGRSISDGKISGEAGDIAASFTGQDFYRELIQRANSVPLVSVFRYYGLRLDASNRKITCPFPSHQGGRERTASFLYYPQTNTFWCFGCKIGVAACDFVAMMDNTTKLNAAYKILELFNADALDGEEIDRQNFSERLEIMLDFSTVIRTFRQINMDQDSFNFIERMCETYDAINLKHKLNNEALRSVVQQLKDKISSFNTIIRI